MSRLVQFAATVALSTVAAVGAAVAGVAPAAAASTCEGVWVVVDASAVGGSASVRCAPGDPASGLDALVGAGHAYSFVPNMPGMVCIIDGRPANCNGAPPDAYWSYWYAQAGGSWTYSQRGAATRDPQPGSVEGWAFGAGNPPSVAPPAPNPAPAPAPAPVPAPNPEPSTPRTTPNTESRPEAKSKAAPGDGTGTGSSGGSSVPTTGDESDGTVPTDTGTSDNEADGAPVPEPPERDRRLLGDLEPGDPRLPRLAADRGSTRGGGRISAPDASVSASTRLDDAEVAGQEQPQGGDAPLWTVGVLLIGTVLGGAVVQQRRRRAGSGP